MSEINLIQFFLNNFRETTNVLLSQDSPIETYLEFERQLKILNFPKKVIQNLYKECGFDNWEDFNNLKNTNPNNPKVQCTLSKIKGTKRAVIANLETYLASLALPATG